MRRAEREAVTLSHHDAVRPEAIRYLNRLSDLLFVLARVLARAERPRRSAVEPRAPQALIRRDSRREPDLASHANASDARVHVYTHPACLRTTPAPAMPNGPRAWTR